MKKCVSVGITLVLLLGIGGCNRQSLKNDSSQAQNSKIEQSDESSQSSDVPSSEDAVSENSSSAQQDVLSQIHAAFNTTVSLMLPTSVPVESGRYLTATTVSKATDYKVNFYETEQPAEINSEAASKGTLLATAEGTEYKDAASAKENIIGYVQADTSNGESLDLGHNIEAAEDAGAGHAYLIWNEGRWCIKLDSPNDPTYKNKKYPDSEQLAKNVVAYLDEHMLPAPQRIGVISIFNWNTSQQTTVQWQNNQTVYQISSPDPMTALKVAVAMK